MFAVVNRISPFPYFGKIAEQGRDGQESGIRILLPFDHLQLLIQCFRIQKRQNRFSDSGTEQRGIIPDQGAHPDRTNAFHFIDI